MAPMAGRARFLACLAAVVALWALQGCVGDTGIARPTVPPAIRITPAPGQNVGGTATAFAQRSILTPTPVGLYTVKPGDTLSKIAAAYETTVDEILAANNLSDPNKILVGQKLTIPTLKSTPAAPSATAPAATLPATTSPEPVQSATAAP